MKYKMPLLITALVAVSGILVLDFIDGEITPSAATHVFSGLVFAIVLGKHLNRKESG